MNIVIDMSLSPFLCTQYLGCSKLLNWKFSSLMTPSPSPPIPPSPPARTLGIPKAFITKADAAFVKAVLDQDARMSEKKLRSTGISEGTL